MSKPIKQGWNLLSQTKTAIFASRVSGIRFRGFVIYWNAGSWVGTGKNQIVVYIFFSRPETKLLYVFHFETIKSKIVSVLLQWTILALIVPYDLLHLSLCISRSLQGLSMVLLSPVYEENRIGKVKFTNTQVWCSFFPYIWSLKPICLKGSKSLSHKKF